MNLLRRMTLIAFILASLPALTSCQGAGEMSTARSAACPTCKTQLTTGPLKGLTFSKHTCPKCHREYKRGGEPNVTVHYCDTCRQIVELCDQCEKERDK